MAENVEKELALERKAIMSSKLAELENERNAEPAAESPQVINVPESRIDDVDLNVDADIETNQQPIIESNDEASEAESDEPSSFFESLEKAPVVAAKDEGGLPAAAQKRVDRAVAAERQAQERIRQLEEKLNAQSAPVVSSPVVSAPAVPEISEDFDPVELMTNPQALAKFVDVLAERKVQATFEAKKQEAAKFAEETMKRKEAEELKEYAKIAGVAEAKFSEKFPDYEDMLENLPINMDLKKQLIYCGDAAPKVAYYLGKHPKLAQEIANMRPEKMIREIAKIENLSRSTSAKKSTAPAPSSVNSRVAATNTQRAEPTDTSLRAGLGLPDRRRGRTQNQIVRK